VWDVLNEAAIMPDFEYGENPLTPVAKDMGAVELIRRCFGRARRANPNATLLLNDYDHSAAFERIVERSLDAGAEIDAIGIQSHMHKGYLGDEHIWEICERFSRFGLPLHWTEATLISGRTYQNMSFHIPRKSWPSTPDGEARQAEEAASFYTTLFSHPAVEAITWWDLVDGHWLNAPSGLLRRDFSPKPAYDALMSLVKDRWWTAPQELSTDSHGRLRFRGFLGDYEARVAEQSGSFDLRETGDTQAEVLLSKP
jgi:GH35 family endo-1,4-beta-xylanase